WVLLITLAASGVFRTWPLQLEETPPLPVAVSGTAAPGGSPLAQSIQDDRQDAELTRQMPIWKHSSATSTEAICPRDERAHSPDTHSENYGWALYTIRKSLPSGFG